MFFVWFYAALPVARKSGQGFNVWFFADKPCVSHSFGLSQTSLVLATALVFRRQALFCSQLLRHACRGGCFAATAACPSGPSGPSGPSCQVFRDPTCATAFDRAPGIRLGCLQGLIASPCTPAPGGTGWRGRSRGTPVGGLEKCGKMFRKSPRFSAERFSKSFATVCPQGDDNCFVPQQFSSPS